MWIAVLLAGCSLLGPTPGSSVNLQTASWRVNSIDGIAVAPDVRLILTFETGDMLAVTTPCRSVRVPYATDTDGSALSISPVGEPTINCEEHERQLHEALASSLSSVESWRIDAGDLVLDGPQPIGLGRIPR
jgi:hypothetical protein